MTNKLIWCYIQYKGKVKMKLNINKVKVGDIILSEGVGKGVQYLMQVVEVGAKAEKHIKVNTKAIYRIKDCKAVVVYVIGFNNGKEWKSTEKEDWCKSPLFNGQEVVCVFPSVVSVLPFNND